MKEADGRSKGADAKSGSFCDFAFFEGDFMNHAILPLLALGFLLVPVLYCAAYWVFGGVGKASPITRTETLVKCVLWYFGALVLALPAVLADCVWNTAVRCVALIPGIWLILPGYFVGLNDQSAIALVVIGYFVQIGLAATAICGRKQSTRHTCYRLFVCLLVLDVCVAWFGPLLFLLISGGPGE